MRNVPTTSIICLAFALLCHSAKAETVVEAIDGDTFRTDRRTIHVYGIDAPELGQPFGRDAKTVLWGRLRRGGVSIKVVGKGGDGIDLAVVDAAGENLNRGMLSRGMAWIAKGVDDEALKSIELEARGRRMGVWHDDKNISPWDYRGGVRTPSPVVRPVLPPQPIVERTVYVTEYGNKYHLAGCGHLHSSAQPMKLSTAKRIYEPCSHCRP